jgi:colicin import membrane protein
MPKEAPKPDSDSLVPAHKWRPRKPRISTHLVTRQDGRTESRRRAERRARADARRLEAERRRLAASLEQTADAIGSGISSSGIKIQFKGPGGGGVPYAGFLQAVFSLYNQAWVLPNGVTDRNATAVASVTIARDGTILEARIIRSSGNPAVDRSVRAALDRVTRTPPFPDGATETERTITINFNAQAKQAM